MFKWIIIFICIGVFIGGISAYSSSYIPISKQIDVKTMQITSPSYILTKWSVCSGSCRNYSSSSSYGGGSYGGK